MELETSPVNTVHKYIPYIMSDLNTIISNAAAITSMAGSAGLSLAKQAGRAARRVGRNARRTGSSPQLTLTRTTAPFSITLVAGEASGLNDATLNAVQTSDLIAMYDQYKINYVDAYFMIRADPGNSGVVNSTNLWITTACDPVGNYTAPTWTQVSSFQNSQTGTLQSDRVYRYRYSPRAVNSLAAGSFAVNTSDWIFLNSTGVTVPHQRLYWDIKSTNTSNTGVVECSLAYNFSVKQAK